MDGVTFLQIGFLVAAIAAGVAFYIKHMKKRIKGYVLRWKEIEKYLKD